VVINLARGLLAEVRACMFCPVSWFDFCGQLRGEGRIAVEFLARPLITVLVGTTLPSRCRLPLTRQLRPTFPSRLEPLEGSLLRLRPQLAVLVRGQVQADAAASSYTAVPWVTRSADMLAGLKTGAAMAEV
jgi:hypothetical protein